MFPSFQQISVYGRLARVEIRNNEFHRTYKFPLSQVNFSHMRITIISFWALEISFGFLYRQVTIGDFIVHAIAFQSLQFFPHFVLSFYCFSFRLKWSRIAQLIDRLCFIIFICILAISPLILLGIW